MKNTSAGFKKASTGWIDISMTLRAGMLCWPKDPQVEIKRITDIEKGDSYTLSHISVGSHTGTHIDAPLHVFKGGSGIDKIPLNTLCGPALVIEIKNSESINVDELASYRIDAGDRILFKTGNSSSLINSDQFNTGYVYLSNESARFLAERKVSLVGIDYLSISGYKVSGIDVHHTLLGAGIWLLEGLDLSAVHPGKYELICLPLKIYNGDGAPARAILRPLA